MKARKEFKSKGLVDLSEKRETSERAANRLSRRTRCGPIELRLGFCRLLLQWIWRVHDASRFLAWKTAEIPSSVVKIQEKPSLRCKARLPAIIPITLVRTMSEIQGIETCHACCVLSKSATG